MRRFIFPAVLGVFASIFLAVTSLGDEMSLPRSTPEAQGIAPATVEGVVKALDEQIVTMHSFMLVRNGHVVAECWWSPESAQKRHVMWSLSKSFASTAVGLAQAEGKLNIDDPVVKYFPEVSIPDASDNLKAMRIRDLLTMTTGHETLPELKNDPNQNWVETFLRHPVPHKPGTKFIYNTPASYMLSAIVQKVTGETALDYLKPRLFQPLGIVNPEWGTSPQGVSLGGYGLSVRTEDIAKFGQLYLQKGKWGERQLLPESWIEQATAKQVSNRNAPSDGNIDWRQGYGFQFWRCRYDGVRGDGLAGQYCIMLPSQNLVVAMTADNPDMSNQMQIIWDKLLPGLESEALPADPAGNNRLQELFQSLKVKPKPLPAE